MPQAEPQSQSPVQQSETSAANFGEIKINNSSIPTPHWIGPARIPVDLRDAIHEVKVSSTPRLTAPERQFSQLDKLGGLNFCTYHIAYTFQCKAQCQYANFHSRSRQMLTFKSSKLCQNGGELLISRSPVLHPWQPR